ncbi:MAG: molybdenum cofactor guanylyltransferase [Oscillatoriales cyanobacterium C42_A2020_001]|nr:molybdenum cofactor guanylyltransferase [Leptolyngbyaceae cyanobacterium C42_A2020_001]
MNGSLSAIVLAGGQSSRMGQDKAHILIQGIPLLRRTCEVALQCSSQVFVVTSRVEGYRSLLPDRCQLIQERFVSNESSPHGPLVGFSQGLLLVQTVWVLLLACDLPYLQADILQRWMAQIDDKEEVSAWLPQTEHGWEPLCGFYQTACLQSLLLFIQQGGRSFQSWLAGEVVRAIAFSSDPVQQQQERRMLFNCNTPEDLATLGQFGRGLI